MKRIVVGISGASGSPLALRFIQALHAQKDIEVHLVTTSSALLSASYELNTNIENPYAEFATKTYNPAALDAEISSGSFPIDAMVVIPCSMKTIAGIANGYTENLLLRAADVAIKEKRPLVLVARETPLSPIHLKNLSYLSTLHNISIVPPVLTYYGNQTTVADMEDHIIGKIFNLLGLSYEPFCTWNPNRASN